MNMWGALLPVALAGAVIGQIALRRARQHIEGATLRRRREARPLGPLRIGGVGLLAAQLAVWIAALRIATEAHPALGRARDAALGIAMRALSAPLFSLSDRSVSGLDLLLLPLAVVALWVGVSFASQLLRASLLRPLGMEGGSEETAASLLRYGLAVFGGLVALQAAGIDVRGLAIAGGVLGVGIGFGLQNIANNFVSGVVIGFERPVRPGDVVRVGDHFGSVLRVGARSTAIRTLDRVTVLVPNSRLLETEVINWSHGDPISRVHVPIGVDYGSDIAAVRGALLAAGRAHPAVLQEPRPRVQLRAFGASSLDFELLVWTRDPKNQIDLVSDLNFRIVEELERHGVQVPFAQLDVHLHTREVERLLNPSVRGLQRAAPARVQRLPQGNGALLEERSPDLWTVAELDAVLARLAGPGGVERADRRHLLRIYRDCFVGGEAIEWLGKHEGLTREEALQLGERLVELGRVRHVLDEHGFRDGHYFYRFAEPALRA